MKIIKNPLFGSGPKNQVSSQWRGSNDYESRKTNSVMRGLFLSNSNLRKEFLSLIAMEQK